MSGERLVHDRENFTFFGEHVLDLSGIEGYNDLSRRMAGYLVRLVEEDYGAILKEDVIDRERHWIVLSIVFA